jgi:hypothetical protein
LSIIDPFGLFRIFLRLTAESNIIFAWVLGWICY